MKRSLLQLLPMVLILHFGSANVIAQPEIPPAANRDTEQTRGRSLATDGRVWGALIYAVNGADKLSGNAAKPPAALANLNQKLEKVFPFSHFEIIGQHTQEVLREYESWVVPSTDLFLKIDSNGPAPEGGVNVHLQFWQQEQVLIKTDALLRPKSPLFISGPKWRDGQLLFVLLLMEDVPAQ